MVTVWLLYGSSTIIWFSSKIPHGAQFIVNCGPSEIPDWNSLCVVFAAAVILFQVPSYFFVRPSKSDVLLSCLSSFGCSMSLRISSISSPLNCSRACSIFVLVESCFSLTICAIAGFILSEIVSLLRFLLQSLISVEPLQHLMQMKKYIQSYTLNTWIFIIKIFSKDFSCYKLIHNSCDRNNGVEEKYCYILLKWIWMAEKRFSVQCVEIYPAQRERIFNIRYLYAIFLMKTIFVYRHIS